MVMYSRSQQKCSESFHHRTCLRSVSEERTDQLGKLLQPGPWGEELWGGARGATADSLPQVM